MRYGSVISHFTAGRSATQVENQEYSSLQKESNRWREIWTKGWPSWGELATAKRGSRRRIWRIGLENTPVPVTKGEGNNGENQRGSEWLRERGSEASELDLEDNCGSRLLQMGSEWNNNDSLNYPTFFDPHRSRTCWLGDRFTGMSATAMCLSTSPFDGLGTKWTRKTSSSLND